MIEPNASAVVHAEHKGEIKTSINDQGTLKAEGKEYSFIACQDGEESLSNVIEFIGQASESEQSEILTHQFSAIDQEVIEVETEIMELEEQLEQRTNSKENTGPKRNTPLSQAEKKEKSQFLKPSQHSHSANQKPEPKKITYSSLFDLARSTQMRSTQVREKELPHTQQKTIQKRDNPRVNQPIALPTSQTSGQDLQSTDSRYDTQEKEKEKDEDQQKEGSGEKDNQQQQKKKKKDLFKINSKYSVNKTEASSNTTTSSKTNQTLEDVGNIFIRFMALMARILGQSEREAHSLYLRIKKRTDNIDLLTALTSKINSERDAIDWSNNEEMKLLVEKARQIGVDIPQGKYQWSEEEKKFLKENIQMRKDSMEKITQLERTDMQRFLQEASQCHQARSNVLKLLKEVIDTVIHNIRP